MSKISTFLYKNKTDFFIITVLLVLFIGIRSINFLNIPPEHMYDEGAFLYASKLIAQGYIPYKNFAASHMPVYLYLLSFLWRLGLNFVGIHIFHLLLTSLIIVPTYLITKHFTNRIFGILGGFFLVFSGSLFYFSRIVILDPIILLLISFALYFYFCEKKKYSKLLSGIFFGLAVSVKITGLITLFCLLLASLFYSKDKKVFFKSALKIILGFCLIMIPLFIWLFTIPNSFSNLITLHLIKQYQLGWFLKLNELINLWTYDFFILFLAPLVSIFILFITKNRDIKILVTSSLMGLLISFFAFKTFYSQHTTQFISALSIVLCYSLFLFYRYLSIKIKPGLIILSCLIILTISTLPFFQTEFSRTITPEREVVEVLKSGKGFLYTATPYFALRSKREITPWYYMALPDSAHKNKIPFKEMNKIMSKSNTILLNLRAKRYLPKETLSFIHNNFRIIYQNTNYTILEK